MAVLAQMRHVDCKAFESWNGFTNVSLSPDPGNDYRTTTYDDSAWDQPVISTATLNPNVLFRFQGTTQQTPELDIGSEGLIASLSSHGQGYIRWYFNPGAGPFSITDEFCWYLPSDSSGQWYLNYDGDSQGVTGTFFRSNLSLDPPAFSQSGILPWFHALLPNAINVLVIAYQFGSFPGPAYVSMGFSFGGALGSTVIYSGAGLEKTYPLGTVPDNWQEATFDDSGWSDSVAETAPSVAATYATPTGSGWVTDTTLNGSTGAGSIFDVSTAIDTRDYPHLRDHDVTSLIDLGAAFFSSSPIGYVSPDDGFFLGYLGVYVLPAGASVASYRAITDVAEWPDTEDFVGLFYYDIDGNPTGGGGISMGPDGSDVSSGPQAVPPNSYSVSVYYSMFAARHGEWTATVELIYGIGTEMLVRRTWVVPESVTLATLEIDPFEDFGSGALSIGDNLYINGNPLTIPARALPAHIGDPQPSLMIDIPVAYLTRGLNNVLAMDVYSHGGPLAVSYKLTALIEVFVTITSPASGWAAVIG